MTKNEKKAIIGTLLTQQPPKKPSGRSSAGDQPKKPADTSEPANKNIRALVSPTALTQASKGKPSFVTPKRSPRVIQIPKKGPIAQKVETTHARAGSAMAPNATHSKDARNNKSKPAEKVAEKVGDKSKKVVTYPKK